MKNKYYIYQCCAARTDETKIIRVIKIQSFFLAESLAIALLATSDNKSYFEKIEIDSEIGNFNYDFENKICDGPTFDDLEDKSLRVCIHYEDGKKIDYNCTCVGEETTAKSITRTTPLILAASGYSRLTHIEYLEKLTKKSKDTFMPYYDSCDTYYKDEICHSDEVMKALQKFFNLYKEDLII